MSRRRDDRAALDAARSGDPDAWEALYRAVYPRLFAFARRRLASEEQAEDAVSETMVRAMDRIVDYRPGPAGLEGWLFGIARNVVLEAYRSGARTSADRPARLGHLQAAAVPGPEGAVLADGGAHHSGPGLRPALRRRPGPAGAEGRAWSRRHADRGPHRRKPGAVRTAQSRALARLRLEYEGLTA